MHAIVFKKGLIISDSTQNMLILSLGRSFDIRISAFLPPFVFEIFNIYLFIYFVDIYSRDVVLAMRIRTRMH